MNKINEKLPFSQKAEKDLKHIFSKVDTSLKHAIKALKDHNIELAKIVTKREDEIDRMEKSLRNEHIDRLKNKFVILKQELSILIY